MPITSDSRAYIAGHHLLEIDGKTAGWLWSQEGGHMVSEVVTEKIGPDHLSKKHIAGVKYEDITISCGTGMTEQFYKWIQDSFDHKYSRKDGAIIAADYNFKEHTRINFLHALITEVGMPALDAASKDAAKMTVKWSPEYTRQIAQASGNIQGQIDPRVQKLWSPANFRLKIDGLDEPCKKVNKIEALVIKQKVVENPVGEERDYQKEPATVEIPNLVITFPESHAKPFYTWQEQLIIQGKFGDGQSAEKNATLEYLSPDLKTTLFTLTFHNLGVFKVNPEKVEAGSEQIRRVKAEMYCEDIKFAYTKKWA